jgi:3-hydroxyisobutyrate dehydrogenase-like beta-hydroxyacid dehydrogenase
MPGINYEHSQEEMKMKVGFIGLGNMGNPMAANILKARHDLTIYDVRREMGRDLEEAGAQWAVNPKEVAAQSDVVLSALPGPREVEAVVLGEEGVFAGLNRGSAYIDTSTNAPTTMRRIAEIGTSRGFHVLDAPISGGVFGAQDATLTVFVGGETGDFERFRPLLQSIGKNVVYMGPAGCGNVTKLVNNVMMYISLIGACEGMAMGAKVGIDPQALLDAIKPSMGYSKILERSMTLFLKGEGMYFATDLAVKDMHLGIELAKEIGVPVELSPLVETVITRFRDGGHGQEDITEIIRDFMQRSGVDMPKGSSG